MKFENQKLMGGNALKIMLYIFIFMLISHSSIAQAIFKTKWKSEADAKVYVSNWKSDADLIVFKTKWKSDANKNEGIWYFTEWKSEGKKIFFTEWKSEADLIIYYTEWKREAGWVNKKKRNLLETNK